MRPNLSFVTQNVASDNFALICYSDVTLTFFTKSHILKSNINGLKQVNQEIIRRISEHSVEVTMTHSCQIRK